MEKGSKHSEKTKKEMSIYRKGRKNPRTKTWIMKENHRNKKWLKNKYLNEKLSINEIGKTCQVAATTILKWLKRYKIKTRSQSMAMKGKLFSSSHRKNMSIVRRGEKNKNWKGGITSLLQQIRTCFLYRQWRSDIFTRDDFTCVLCGRKESGKLEADHYPKRFSEIFHENKIKTIEEALECEEFWNINNGRTLCQKCHILIR